MRKFLKKKNIVHCEDNSDFLLELLSPCEGDRESLRELLSPCEEPRLGLNQLNVGTDRRRVQLQDEDRSGNDSHLVPAFPRLCSGMFPERFRSVSVSVGSREIRLIRQSTQNAGLCPAELLEQFFRDSASNLLRNLYDIFLVNSRNGRETSFVASRSYDFPLVFLLYRLLTFVCFSMLPFF